MGGHVVSVGVRSDADRALVLRHKPRQKNNIGTGIKKERGLN
jgi:hypothetical protein